MQHQGRFSFLPCHKCAQLVTFVCKWAETWPTTIHHNSAFPRLKSQIFWLSGELVVSSQCSRLTWTTYCVWDCTCHRDPAQTCRKIICKRKQLFLVLLTVKFSYGIYLPIGLILRWQFKSSGLWQFSSFASRIAKQSVSICIIIVHISKFSTLKIYFFLTCKLVLRLHFLAE